MICTNCNHQNEPRSTFCTQCGRSLLQDRLTADENVIESLKSRIVLIENLLSKYVTNGTLSQEEIDQITQKQIFFAEQDKILEFETLNDSESEKVEIIQNELSSIQSTEALMEQSSAKNENYSSFEKHKKSPLQANKGQLVKWDQFLGLNWLAIIGGLAMLFSLGIFSLAFYSTVSPVVRFLFGSLISLGFIGIGVATLKNYDFWAQIMTGVGLSIGYLSVYAAFGIWNLFNPLIGLVILALIGLSGLVLSIKSNGMWIAILSIIGVFISPFLIDITNTNIDMPLLISYLIIMDLSVLFISIKRNWKIYNQISLWGSYLFLYHAMVNLELNDLGLCLFALGAVHLIFIGVTTIFHIIKDNKPTFQDFLLAISNSTLFFFICGDLLESNHSEIFASISLSLAGINGIMALFMIKKSKHNREYSTVFTVQAAVFLAAAIPIYFSEAYTTIIWALLGAGVTAIGLKYQQWKWRLYSSILFILTIGNFIITDLVTTQPYGIPIGFNADNWLINTRTITSILITATLWMTYFFYQRKSWILKLGSTSNSLDSPVDKNIQSNFIKFVKSIISSIEVKFFTYELWRPLLLGLSGTILLWITMIVHISNSPSEEQFKAIMVTIITAAYGTLIVVISVWKNNISFRMLGSILIILASTLSVTLVPYQSELSPNMWISLTFFSYIFTTILLIINMALQNTFRIWPNNTFRQINFISKFGNNYVQEVYFHILGISTFIVLLYELSYQWGKVGINFYRLEDLAFTFAIATYGFIIFNASNRYMENIFYSKISYRLSGLILFGISFIKLLTLDMMTANKASILYEWDGFLWLNGFAFIPFLNPYFILATTISIFGIIILKSTIKNGQTEIYNWQKFTAVPFMAFSIAAIVLVTGTREIIQWFYHAPFDQPPIILSIYWTIYSLSLVGIGIKLKNQRLRLIGFGILSVPIIKIFFWDTWKTEPIIGFLGLFIFGSILLGISFVYQRNKGKIHDFLYGEEKLLENHAD